MFQELVHILFVQFILLTVVAAGVYVWDAKRSQPEAFYNNSYMYLYGIYNNNIGILGRNNASDQRAVQMSVQKANNNRENSQSFNLQLDSSVDSMNISTTPMSSYASNFNKPARTLVSYALSGNPSVTYGVPVNVTEEIVSSKEVSAAKIKAPDVMATNINIAAGGCIGQDQKLCFKDGKIETGKMAISDASIAGANISGIKVGARTQADEKGENRKTIQTIDADYIELKNNKLVGGDSGELKVGNFTIVEDHPGRLSFFYKKKRVMELDATGSRATDLYLYNQDNNENYVYMSSATKLITKNVKPDERD